MRKNRIVDNIVIWSITIILLISTTPLTLADPDVCKDSKRTIHYDIAAIDINLPVNGWGDFSPQAMMYALDNPKALPNVGHIKDDDFKLYDTTDMSVPDKFQPLVLRANKGDCIEINLTNRLDKIHESVQVPFDQGENAIPIEPHDNLRRVGLEVTGLPYNPGTSNGANLGFNPDTTVGIGESRVLRLFAQRTGGYLFRDINVQYPQDTINKGLYGMIIVEEEDSVWIDSITGRNFLNTDPQNSINLNDLIAEPSPDPITGKSVYLGVGASIFAVIHQLPGRPLPDGALLWENVSGNDYRSYAMVMQDEMEGVIGPIEWNVDGQITKFGTPFFPATGLADSTLLMNYKSEPLRNRMGAWLRHRGNIPTQGNTPQSGPAQKVKLPNGKIIDQGDDFCNGGTFNAEGNDYKFYPCEGEESHLQSWPFGDPAVPLPRAYWGDPVIFYVGTASTHETHTYHQHTHRWFHDPDQANLSLLPLPENLIQKSNRLDVQGVGPGEVFKIVIEQGAGASAGTAGDSIMHCHLYPHFAGGLWSAFRVFDMLRINFTDSTNINSNLENGESILYPDDTQEAVLVPLPAKETIVAEQLALTGERKAPPSPRGMPNRTAGIPTLQKPGYPNFIAGKFGQKALQPPKFIVDPDTGIPNNDRAIPTPLEINASYDGLSPGVTLVDPCSGPNHEFGSPDRKPTRIYQPVAIQVPFLLNSKGLFNPEQRAYVERELVSEVRRDPSKLKPYSFRANVGDCVEVYGTNDLQPNPESPTLGLNDGTFHGPTVTNEVSNHVHIIRFDQLGSDGTSVNWNYDISQRVGETGAYRWFVDINGRTIFSHDHQFPTSHQQGGMWSAFINEPMNSTFFKSDGRPLGPTTGNPLIDKLTVSGRNIKGVGVEALINVTVPTKDTTGGASGGGFNISSFREFVVHYSDFTPAFLADPKILKDDFDQLKGFGTPQGPLNEDPFRQDLNIFSSTLRKRPFNPPFSPDDYGADQGITTMNYRVEPFQLRVNVSNKNATQREPAYMFSSRVHGDPETAVFRAYMNDPVVVRLMDGAHEEHHVFELHGHRWLHQPSDPFSFLTDNQASNIGEWFNYELQGNVNMNKTPPGFKKRDRVLLAGIPGDYLFGSPPTSDMWDGTWGIFRVENSLKSDLKTLPNNPNPTFVPGLGLLDITVDPSTSIPPVSAGLISTNTPCPTTAPKKKFNIVAIAKPLTYNDEYKETDPFGLMYVLAEDKVAVLSGIKKPEPLVIRANEGDCIEVNLKNELPDLTTIAKSKNVTFPDGTLSLSSLDPKTLQHFGDAQMPTTVTGLPLNPQFEFVKWPLSRRVSLHPHLIKEVAAVGDGATVGFMRDQTIGPGQSITYLWYADVELGATLLDDYGDLRSHRHHGLFAGLVIEPKGAKYFDPKNPFKEIRSGTSAVIRLPNGDQFREFVPLLTDGLNLRKDNVLIPDMEKVPAEEVEHQPCSPPNAVCFDVEDQGESGINYRTERLVDRVPLALDAAGFISEEIFNIDAYKAFSSKDFGDPATPVFESFAGDPVVVRPMVPADLARVRSIGLNGHVMKHEPNDPDTNIVNVEGSFGVGKSFNYWLIGGAGGEQKQPGDYMYNDRKNSPDNSGVQSGLWGIFRVHPIAGVNPTVKSLTSIEVISPHGGETWLRGATNTIKWAYSGNPGTDVKIELYKSGIFNKLITSSTPKGTGGFGSFNWLIPATQTIASDYKIKITSNSNSEINDTSDHNFAISGPKITVLSPNGGENWKIGTTHTISWSSLGSTGTNVKIELLKAGALNRVISSSTLNDGSFSWTISSTQTTGTDYKIRITSTTNSAFTDTSNNNFIISI